MSESFKNSAAKFLVPFVVGLTPSAFLVGKAYGGDKDRLDSVEREVTTLKAVYAADHDVLIRLDTNVAWLRSAMEKGDQGELAKALAEVRDLLKVGKDR